MIEQKKRFSPEELEDEIRQAIHYLQTDALAIAHLIGVAKEYGEDKEIEIRREVRPIAVDLLYLVIGVPTTQKEYKSYMKQQKDGNDD